jgi:hypothetical protein
MITPEDDNDGAWAHEQELEQRRREEEDLLSADPGYMEFLAEYALQAPTHS